MNFGEILKKFREGERLSQKEFAKILNIPTSTLGSWEAGLREPKVKKMMEISELLQENFPITILNDDLNSLTPEKNSKEFEELKIKYDDLLQKYSRLEEKYNSLSKKWEEMCEQRKAVFELVKFQREKIESLEYQINNDILKKSN